MIFRFLRKILPNGKKKELPENVRAVFLRMQLEQPLGKNHSGFCYIYWKDWMVINNYIDELMTENSFLKSKLGDND